MDAGINYGLGRRQAGRCREAYGRGNLTLAMLDPLLSPETENTWEEGLAGHDDAAHGWGGGWVGLEREASQACGGREALGRAAIITTTNERENALFIKVVRTMQTQNEKCGHSIQ